MFSKAKIHLHAAHMVILRLNIAQEERTLSVEELDLRSRLKRRVISLVVLQRARKRQCARIANLREGDANTKNFHRRVNARRRKNHIHRIRLASGWVTEHSRKEKIIHDHFSGVMGVGSTPTADFNWDELNIQPLDLHQLGNEITD